MSKFDPETINVMRSVLEEVCSHIPARATPARTFIAARILECASSGKQSHDLLMEAGRRAVIDQCGSMDAVLSASARTHPGVKASPARLAVGMEYRLTSS